MVPTHIQELLAISRKGRFGPALSIYLDVDQSNPANRNREFESTLRTLLRPIENRLIRDESALQAFHENATRCTAFVSGYHPDAKTLVLLSAQAADFFRALPLQVPFCHRAVWDSTLHLQPLIEALDEYERYAVALIHRGQARLFFGCMGEIEESEGIFEPEVRQYKKVGTDQWRSQGNFERHAREHSQSHARRVAHALVGAHLHWPFDRLILAGAVASRTELGRTLPKRLFRKVTATIPLPIEATPEQVLEAVRKIEFGVEREEELRTVRDLLTAAGKRRRAVVGFDETVHALARGQVHELVYADGFQPNRSACLECGLTQPDTPSHCEQCGGEVEPAEGLLQEAIERVDSTGGKIEQVKEQAAQLLIQRTGGVGAFLRF